MALIPDPDSCINVPATYTYETWKVRTAQKLNVFHQHCLRNILRVAYREHITNEEILDMTGLRKLADSVMERRFRTAGHVLRLPNHQPATVAMIWIQEGGRWSWECTKMTWQKTFQQDLEKSTWGWRCRNGPVEMVTSCCLMCRDARQELSLKPMIDKWQNRPIVSPNFLGKIIPEFYRWIYCW